MTDAFVLVLCMFAVIVAPLAVELVTVRRRLRWANGRMKCLLMEHCMLQMHCSGLERELSSRYLWTQNAIVWISLMEAPVEGVPSESTDAVNRLLAEESEATQ